MKTFIVKSGRYEEMKAVYENGYASLMAGAAEIAKALWSVVEPGRRIEGTEIFRNNSVEHVDRTVDVIMGQVVIRTDQS